MICPNCNQEVNPDAIFCGNCGYQLGSATQPVQATNTVEPSQPIVTSSVQPQEISPVNDQNNSQSTTSTSTQSTYTATQSTPTAQPYSFQHASSGSGAFAGGAANAPSHNSSTTTTDSHNNSKAIAAFVCGVLGCVGWIIPIVGVILGILAIVFGTIAIKSPRRVLAIIGIVLAVPVIAVSIFFWVRAAQHILKERSNSVIGITTPCELFACS